MVRESGHESSNLSLTAKKGKIVYTVYKVYWTYPNSNNPYSQDMLDLGEALRFCESLRKHGCRFVTMVSENPDLVGKSGAAGVVDGKLPDGSDYDWTKNDRVGAAFKTPL